jgi:DNA-directed RNA polymerase alpha subunit
MPDMDIVNLCLRQKKNTMIKILTIIGARPQIIKAAAISRAISASFSNDIEEILVHTGFEIVSDGSIHPKDALTEAAKVLIHHFMLFSDERITLEADEIAQTETYDEESLHMRQLLKTKLVDMDLSVRALNCLKAAEVDTLGDLVSFNKNDLMKFRNFGKKSLTELEELVINKGLSFGMDLSKYKLDKD